MSRPVLSRLVCILNTYLCNSDLSHCYGEWLIRILQLVFSPTAYTAKIITYNQSYQTNSSNLYLTWIILFQSYDQVWVRHFTFIIPSFQPLSPNSQLLKPSLSLRELDACAGQMPPAEPDLIQLLFPSMSLLIAQLVDPVLTLKYLPEPEECCSTCKQSMPSTMSIFVNT